MFQPLVKVLIVFFVIFQDCMESMACDGECVPIACDQNQLASGKAKPTFDLRYQASTCDGLLEVCCPTESITPLNDGPPPANHIHKCGTRNDDGVGFRIQGNYLGEAQYGELPWTLMVSQTQLLFDVEKDVQIGSASLLTPWVALTAAHILLRIPQKSISVTAGEWNKQKDDELFPVQRRKVSRTIVHEGYENKHHNNNLALLVVDKPFKYQEHIQPICLPPPSLRFDSKSCVTGGWGKKTFQDQSGMNIMKRISLPLVNFNQCEAILRTTRLGSKFTLHPSYICAGGLQDVDSCTGDGGAPLVCPAPNQVYYQVGIVAWGVGCGENNVPGAYTNVMMFVNWITNKLRQLPGGY